MPSHSAPDSGRAPASDDDLTLSLANAALIAYRKATNGRQPDADALDYVARMIAIRTRVFACSSARCADPRRLTPEEVFEGRFEGGGTRITYRDGRDSFTCLCMRLEDLPRVVDEITSLYRQSSRPG